MKRAALILSLAFTLGAAVTKGPPRSDLAQAENLVDQSIQRKWSDDPLILIGSTRAFYVDGFGVVMTTELNLVAGPTIGPFSPTLTPEMKDRHRKRKLERLPQLKDLMSTTLQQAKGWFPTLRDDEQIALGVQMYRYSWEDPNGIPSQLVLQTTKRKDSTITTRETN
jgi:hypothetical protein